MGAKLCGRNEEVQFFNGKIPPFSLPSLWIGLNPSVFNTISTRRVELFLLEFRAVRTILRLEKNLGPLRLIVENENNSENRREEKD